MAAALYPLRIVPVLHTRIWGGRGLQTRLHKTLPTDEPYGESWEIFWQNRIADGPLAGQTLGEAIAANPGGMLGQPAASAEYPLLVKFIQAQDWLSVQVHPDDAWAQKLEGEPRGKTECWYIIDAEPGAKLAYGLAEPLDADGFRAAVNAGRAKEVMQYVEVTPGDFVFVPAGTMHAIGPGILLYELQQTSDTTYRVYDWDRMGLDGKPRPLHLDKALAVTQYTLRPPAKTPYTLHELMHGVRIGTLIDSTYFGLQKFALEASLRLSSGNVAHLLTCIQGGCLLQGDFGEVEVRLGDSLFLPAGLGDYVMEAEGEFLVARAK